MTNIDLKELDSIKVNIEKEKEMEDKMNSIIVPIIKAFIIGNNYEDVDNLLENFSENSLDMSMIIVDALHNTKSLKEELTFRVKRLYNAKNNLYLDYYIIDNNSTPPNDRLFSVKIFE